MCLYKKDSSNKTFLYLRGLCLVFLYNLSIYFVFSIKLFYIIRVVITIMGISLSHWVLQHRSFDPRGITQKLLTRECALPGRKVRSETISNRKSVLKLDHPENFSCLFAVRTEKNTF